MNPNNNIAFLINNVGLFYSKCKPEKFTKIMNIDKLINDLIHVNILCHVDNTFLSIPSMKCGSIIFFVSSLSSIFPFQHISLYSASKIFINFFSQAIRSEHKVEILSVQLLLPGYVSTKMIYFIKPRFNIPSSYIYAKNILNINQYFEKNNGFWFHNLTENFIKIFDILLRLLNLH